MTTQLIEEKPQQLRPITDMPKKSSKPARHSQGGLMLWHGLTVSGLARFLATRPPIHWSRLHRALSLPFSAVFNSTFAALESLVYGSRIAKTEVKHPPLFVLGYWRSGTTLLQTLLSKDPNLQHLPLYRTLFPWHFLLTEGAVTRLTAPFVPKNRPMDNMKVSWDAPQEDDVSLYIMSQVSPYLLLAHPQDHSHFWKALEFDKLPAKDLDRWKNALHLLVRKLTFADDRRIMMKSPFHTFHVSTLLEMFPDARFIYIHRNPYNVFRSSVHLRSRMIDENTLGRAPFEGHEDEVIRSYKYGFEVYEQDKQLVPKGRLHEICYEDLAADPIETLRAAYTTLDMPDFDNLATAIEPELETLQNYKKNQFVDDPKWVDKVYTELKAAFDRFGYEKPVVSSE